MSRPESSWTTADEDDIPSFIVGTPEERARIARRGSCLIRSCLVAVAATLIFEGVVLGGSRFGWVGAVLGPFAIILVGMGLGWLGSLAMMFGNSLADRRRDRGKTRGRGAAGRHPLGDDEIDRPAP